MADAQSRAQSRPASNPSATTATPAVSAILAPAAQAPLCITRRLLAGAGIEAAYLATQLRGSSRNARHQHVRQKLHVDAGTPPLSLYLARGGGCRGMDLPSSLN